MSAWRDRAGCLSAGPDLFFSTEADEIAQALAVCERCPVLGPCRQVALAENHGVWGGLSEAERRKIRKRVAKGMATNVAVALAIESRPPPGTKAKPRRRRRRR